MIIRFFNAFRVWGLVLLMLSAGCSKQPTTSIKVGYAKVATSLPTFIAQEMGFFTENKLNVELVEFNTANQVVEALERGDIQATSVCVNPPVYGVMILKPGFARSYLWEVLTKEIIFDAIVVSKNSGIKGIKDLQGKKIATFPGSALKIFTQLIAEKALNKPFAETGIEVIPMLPSNQLPALSNGSVDALFTLEPLVTIAVAKGIGKIIEGAPICRYLHDGKPWPIAGFWISNDFSKNNPKLAKKFVKSMYKAVDYFRDNPQKSRSLLSKYTPLNEELANKVAITDFWKASEFKDASLLEEEINILYDNKILRKKIDAATIIWKD